MDIYEFLTCVVVICLFIWVNWNKHSKAEKMLLEENDKVTQAVGKEKKSNAIASLVIAVCLLSYLTSLFFRL